MVAIMVIMGIIAYLAAGGFACAKMQAIGKPRCRWNKTSVCDSMCGHSFLAGISTFLWPATLPMFLGLELGRRSSDGVSRGERRRQEQVEQAKHRVELARIKAQEIELTERAAGIKTTERW